MEFIYEGLLSITPQQVIMYLVGLLLIYLAIKKEYEPALLLPMGFGAILVNLPLSGVINQTMSGIGEVNGIIEWLFNVGIEASEALPILLFIGIGAMIDFGPLLSQPVMFLFGAAAQFGIFFAICAAALMGFDLKDAASIGIIGAADGPTSILVCRPNCRRRLFLHGAGSHCTALCHPSGHHEKGKTDPHARQTGQTGYKDHQDPFPDNCYIPGRTDFPRLRIFGRFPDVRQPAS